MQKLVSRDNFAVVYILLTMSDSELQLITTIECTLQTLKEQIQQNSDIASLQR